jgi:hypothetical protein
LNFSAWISRFPQNNPVLFRAHFGDSALNCPSGEEFEAGNLAAGQLSALLAK